MKKYTGKIIASLLAVIMTVSYLTPVSLAAPLNEGNSVVSSKDIVLSDSTKAIIEAARVMASVDELSDEVSGTNDEEVEVEADTALAGETSGGLTQEQNQELADKYNEYMAYMQEHADLFGIQTPYFTNKDDVCPVGSLLAIAGIPNQYLALGMDFVVQNVMSYDDILGVIELFHYANVFAVEMKKTEIEAARDEALKAVSDADTDIQKHLQLTDWLAQNCTFDMPYIMEMDAPVTDTESAMYQDKMNIYNVMYENIKGQVYDGYYQYLVYQEGYPEETAAQVAETMAKSYMDDPTEDGSDNGAASAMVLASSIINLWEGSHVGALTYGTAVCLGYSNAYTYLVQYLYSDIYKNSDGTWKTYEELNNGSNGNWDAIVDYVRITFDTEVTMYGVTQENFQSDHYWNAVKIDGKWYYVDPCYVDVYVEVMARDRVETNGNMNHLYFMFSHDTAESLYEDYYKELDTLYADLATDTTYEEAWFAFAKSPVYRNNDTYYYVYDSTDLIEMQNSYETTEEDIEYKLVSKSTGNSNKNDATAEYDRVLIDFTGGQVYNPSNGRMSSSSLISTYYDEFETYKEDYPSLVISAAYYNNKIYFNLSNCVFSYDLSNGDVQRLIEYNTVTAERDMTVAFGGMGFTKSDSEGDYGITVKEPPIAGLTIKDGQLTVDIGTTLGYISGKKSHTYEENEPDDTSNYGYMFEETHYNPEYLYATYSEQAAMSDDIDKYNDNDEFMWSANIYDTIDMNHLTGTHSQYEEVTVDATCTKAAYTEQRCATCGLIQNGNSVSDSSLSTATHEYVKFKEKYYTKTDDRWNTKVYYVCIHCKDAVGQNPGNLVEPDQENMTNVWTWALNGSAASVYTIPAELAHIKLDCVWENPSIGSTRKVASKIKKEVEGYCDEGASVVCTATSGELTDVKYIENLVQPHQYIASDLKYDWNTDYTRCDVSYACDYCGKEGKVVCKDDAITEDYVEPTCVVNGKTIYTAHAKIDGVTYSQSVETNNENKAFGHTFVYNEEKGEEICTTCGSPKTNTKITLPENSRGIYTGEPTKTLEEQCIIEGTTNGFTITYFVDEACTEKTTKSEHGAKKTGGAPSEMGIYYAIASVEEDDQYKGGESGVCKFILGPDKVKNLKDANVADGVKLTWKKVSEAEGYEIYRRDPNGAYEKVKTFKKNTTLEWIDEDVTEGETYVYDVRSYANTFAGKVYCETDADGELIVRTLITASNTRTNGVSLKWTQVPKAKSYRVYRKLVGSEDSYTLLETLDAAETSYKDKTAKNGKKYYYYVKPDTSGTTNVVTKLYLNDPKIEEVKAPKAEQLKVTWSKNSKADGYRIRYSTTETFDSYKTVKVTSKDTLSKTIKNLEVNTKYYVKVQAYKKSSGKTYYSAWSKVTSKKTKK